MTATELGDVELLLARVLPDPMRFAERVLGQLLERLGPGEVGGSDNGGGQAGDRVGSTTTFAPASDDHPDVEPGTNSTTGTVWQRTVDRNIVLAAALGACECWGEDSGCRWCEGQGRSGWTAPDDALFVQYVAPVLVKPPVAPEQQHSPDAGSQPPEGPPHPKSATMGEQR